MSVKSLLMAASGLSVKAPTGFWMAQYNFSSGASNPVGNGAQYYGIGADSSGNVYVGFGTISSSGSCAIIKTDVNGTILWQRQVNQMFPSAFTADTNGNSYFFGGSGGNVQVVKFDSSGTLAWMNQYYPPGGNGTSFTLARTLCVDPSGNIFLTGYSTQSGYANGYDMYVVKLNSSGVIQWSMRIDTSSSGGEQGMGLVADTNYVYVTGTLTAHPSTLIRITQAGSLSNTWYNSNGNNNGRGLGVDSSGNMYWSFQQHGVCKVNSSGSVLWSKTDTVYNESVSSIVVDASGNSYTLEDASTDDYCQLISKRDTNGNLIWSYGIYNGSGYATGGSGLNQLIALSSTAVLTSVAGASANFVFSLNPNGTVGSAITPFSWQTSFSLGIADNSLSTTNSSYTPTTSMAAWGSQAGTSTTETPTYTSAVTVL